MSTSAAEFDARARNVRFSGDEMIVELGDGRKIVVPIDWFPRLLRATSDQRDNWSLIGDGKGIHWPDLDEDIHVGGLLAGIRAVRPTRRRS